MKSFRLIVILLAILCVVFLVFSLVTFSGLQTEKKNRVATENSYKDLLANKEDLQKQLDDQKKLKTDLESQLADLKGKVTSLQDKAEKLAAQIAEEKKDKEEALAKLSDKDKEIEEVKTNWESEKSSRAAVQEQFDKLQKEYVAVQKKLGDLQATNQGLLKQVEDLQAKKEVDLERIVVKPGVDAEGKVLVVNKEFNFIVVAAGNNKGITPGVTFGVYRNNKLVAKATVEKVYETMSAANILPDSGEIKEGDIAKAM
ncbi:MAG: hypothetical protein PHX64_01560 [Candidatus Omnitrophica bacterium]|nr:hypothetical protein [Candidatus Omnitrophota bacterium]MDD5310426.1 hypothetical protein [Candidatus Omnitrophota bacterium]MDD5546730.1 hypothetical protein [Candidatus Omnitrophota bacterium]